MSFFLLSLFRLIFCLFSGPLLHRLMKIFLCVLRGREEKFFIKSFFDFFGHEGFLLRFFHLLPLRKIFPMLILHCFVLACFFFKTIFFSF